jgi:BirA family biotin operon repressor/biotin-[acetyl-CoA-carboxylase] ligase
VPLRQRELPRHAARAEEAALTLQARTMADPHAPTPGEAAGAHRPQRWDVQRHWPALQALLPGLTIEVLASVDSTNDRLLAGAQQRDGAAAWGRRSGDLQPCLLVAERQTAGRGRRGRRWFAEPGASLTFSLALRLEPPSWSGLSLAVGVALADALDPAAAAAPRIGLKWPNDLWLIDAPGRGRKLGGILIETVPTPGGRLAVIGIGLNVRPLPATADHASGYACLHELQPQLGAPAALWQVARPLVLALQRFEAEGLQPSLAAYARRDLLAGQVVQTTDPAVAEGVAAGIDADGALCVRAGGVLHRVVGGEVSVRPAGG